ncbi:hypothetical protein VNO77_24446 [Canavalia gladiata]|uniref:BSD domain-containing protein n=1 Tax=Canavalia gladiata TaxID=3824 RepID=A0AAN9QG92_CANGL
MLLSEFKCCAIPLVLPFIILHVRSLSLFWFPLADDTELFDVPAVSNIRQDLTEWQEKHANLVLSTVKEISRLRYELCPRVMKERKFWRIYFILVNNHIAHYENQYMEDAKQNSSEEVRDHKVMMEPLKVELTSNQEVLEVKKATKSSNLSTEQDLDVFLLGDRNSDDDDDPDDGNGGYDMTMIWTNWWIVRMMRKGNHKMLLEIIG